MATTSQSTSERQQRGVHRDPSSNRFCGPAALSILTGYHVDACEQALKAIIGDLPIKGVWDHAMLQTLSEWNFKWQETFGIGRNSKGLFLIRFKAHYGVLENGTYYDNAGNEMPRGKILQVWEIWK